MRTSKKRQNKNELSTNQNKIDLNRTAKCSVANNMKIFSKSNVFWTTTIGLSIFNNSRDKYNSTEKVKFPSKHFLQTSK